MGRQSSVQLLRAPREQHCGTAKRTNEFSPPDANCHVTLPREVLSMQWRTISRFSEGRTMLCAGRSEAAHVSDGFTEEFDPVTGRMPGISASL